MADWTPEREAEALAWVGYRYTRRDIPVLNEARALLAAHDVQPEAAEGEDDA
jgi:hypothetical protein